MRKWIVIYSSVTGNTRAIAEEIAETAGADLFRVQEGLVGLCGQKINLYSHSISNIPP